MVKYLKFNLHSLFIAIVSYGVCLHKQNMIVNHNRLQHRLTFATKVCYSYTAVSTPPMKQQELVVNRVLNTFQFPVVTNVLENCVRV